MERFICIHGHFYQPPRENPWLEEIEIDDSARPYHDWNERINAECSAPNSASRLLDGEGRITTIVSNYARMSFNFGPTLLSWMEKHAPNVYAAIIQADLLSREQHAGHGNALAQVYNHLIMPLANTRDKRTQVAWAMIRLALATVADTAIIPRQDLLGLGSESRMNRPGTARGNWTWRFHPEDIAPRTINRLAGLTAFFGRAA